MIPSVEGMRKTTWTVLVAGCALTLSAVLAPHAEGAVGPDDRRSPAAVAIDALAVQAPRAAETALPTDFATVMGYRPAVRDGMLVNPNGSCSSPVPLPAEFDSPCMAHDLGYDLLRYADRTGTPVGAWARLTLDRQLDDRLHAACLARPNDITRASCRVVASGAGAAVAANSWRQDNAVPRQESFGPYAPAVGALAIVGFAALRRRSDSVTEQGVPA